MRMKCRLLVSFTKLLSSVEKNKQGSTFSFSFLVSFILYKFAFHLKNYLVKLKNLNSKSDFIEKIQVQKLRLI
jgi:hypothetical protein